MNDWRGTPEAPLEPKDEPARCEWCGEPAEEWDGMAGQYCCRACAMRIARNRLFDPEDLLTAAGFKRHNAAYGS